jgi:hypothetical protein
MVKRSVRFAAWSGVLAVLAALPACGGDDGDEPSKDDAAKESASDDGDAGGMPTEEQMQKQADDTRKALAEAAGGKEIKAVDPKEMKALLPEAIGAAKRRSAESQRMNQGGMDISQTRASYDPEPAEGAQPSFDVEIMDLGNLSGAMAMGFTPWAMTQYERETDTGYEKTTKWKGYPAMEEYDTESKHGKLEAYVAKRFIVKVTGNDATMEQIHAAMEAIDVAKIASLGK